VRTTSQAATRMGYRTKKQVHYWVWTLDYDQSHNRSYSMSVLGYDSYSADYLDRNIKISAPARHYSSKLRRCRLADLPTIRRPPPISQDLSLIFTDPLDHDFCTRNEHKM
jgi:hypothetical protein